MKLRQCDTCDNTYEYKRKASKYCSKSCKQIAYLKRHGKEAPDAFKPLVARLSKPKPIRTVGNGEAALTVSPRGGLSKISSDIQHWQNVIYHAQNGQVTVDTLLWTFGGAIVGAMAGGKNKNAPLVGAAIAGLIGNTKSKSARDQVIANAYRQIKLLESQQSTVATFSELLAPNATILPSSPIASPSEYKRVILDEYHMRNSEYGYLFGNPSKPFAMMIYGLPGQGKTTFAAKFANYFNRTHGKALYMASEQGGYNLAFQKLIKSIDGCFDVHTKARGLGASEVAKIVKDGSYELVVIDSANHMGLGPNDVEEIRRLVPKLSVVSLLQSVKDGDFRGDNDWAHNSDVIIQVQSLKAIQTKSRFSAPSEIEIKR